MIKTKKKYIVRLGTLNIDVISITEEDALKKSQSFSAKINGDEPSLKDGFGKNIEEAIGNYFIKNGRTYEVK